MMLGRRELVQISIEAEAAARSALENVTSTLRERNFVDALTLWLVGKPYAARDRIEGILKLHPQDSLAMKVSHAISFILGDAKVMRSSVERLLPTYDESHAGHGYLLGCHAFSLEETGEYRQAEIAGRKGMLKAADDAWGLHAVAHVYDMTCKAKAGLEWLDGREEAWAHCNNFRYHVWWHKAQIGRASCRERV